MATRSAVRAGMVVAGRGLDDPVTQADVLGALATCAEEHLGRRGVAVFLEEVVLDLPHDVEAEAVRQFDLLERVWSRRYSPSSSQGRGSWCS